MDSGNSINYATGTTGLATHSPDGQLTSFISGNSSGFAGITNNFSYNKRLQPITMSATSPSQTVFSLTYDFHLGAGNNGNVWAITNNRDATRSQSFTYDALNRLISAQTTGTDCSVPALYGKTKYWANTYAYDAWGNLTDKNKTGCGAEDIHFKPDAQNRIHPPAGADYVYDTAGNMTTNAHEGQNYTYDAENRITGAAGYTYTYDADGNRVAKSNGATGTLYWYMSPGMVGESDLSGNLTAEYAFFDGERIARRDNPGSPSATVAYYFSDHLKTASVITDSAGNIKSDSDYYPWGGELQFVASDSNHYKFTGKERDTETNLDYFGARYYGNALGRFITPDWAAKATAVPYADFADPQSLNLYTYVRNLPTTQIDVDGHDDAAATTIKVVIVSAGRISLSKALWAAGSVALPGVLGGGLANIGINHYATTIQTRADAEMQEAVVNNKMLMAQQAALSQDAQAGALIKAGKDAIEGATGAIEAAEKAMKAGKYKDPADVQDHIDKLREGAKDVEKKIQGVKTAVGQKARDAAKDALKQATKDVKGHEKDLRQKPQVKPKEESQ